LIHPDERAKGNITNSRMIIDACRPFHWRDRFSPITKARPEIAAKAREKFGYLLNR
jgi:4-hydroxy-3-polyprenylbenzoate decarboxylase